MKKKILPFFALTALMTITGCSGTGATTPYAGDDGEIVDHSKDVTFSELTEYDIGTKTTVDADKLSELGFSETNPLKIALVTDSGTLNDHSFNESAWNGVNEFATENGGGTVAASNCVESGSIQTKYYQPAEDHYDTQGRLEAMKSAKGWGADVIALPGYLFQSAIKSAIDSKEFDDIAFLALDCVKEDSDNNNAAFEFTDNVTSVIYREEQSGFLAGYGAVMDGYRNLGFIGGMAVPAVVRYGSGYCQGADAAAKELGLKNNAVKVQYYYAGEFGPTDQATSYANSWYQRGTEVIFACGGAVYQSVTSAVNTVKKPWIGVDVNQHADSSLGTAQQYCITSAMKNLKETTKVLLSDWVNNDKAWNDDMAGEVVTVGAKSGNCVLPTPETTGDDDCWGFENFTQELYDTILEGLKAGTVKVNSNSDNEELSKNNFGCSSRVAVNYIVA